MVGRVEVSSVLREDQRSYKWYRYVAIRSGSAALSASASLATRSAFLPVAGRLRDSRISLSSATVFLL